MYVASPAQLGTAVDTYMLRHKFRTGYELVWLQ